MALLDCRVNELGISPDEHCAMGGVRQKPSEVEKVEFEAAIWAAFAQCFVSYEEAIQSIKNFNLGVLV